MELTFGVRVSGRYRLRVLATTAPDFGAVRHRLDGRAPEPVFDLYSGRELLRRSRWSSARTS